MAGYQSLVLSEFKKKTTKIGKKYTSEATPG